MFILRQNKPTFHLDPPPPAPPQTPPFLRDSCHILSHLSPSPRLPGSPLCLVPLIGDSCQKQLQIGRGLQGGGGGGRQVLSGVRRQGEVVSVHL